MTCCASRPRSWAGTPPRRSWSATCARPNGSRTHLPQRSRSTARCAAPCTPPAISPIEAYRRRIARQLNKGQNLHALRRNPGLRRRGRQCRRRHHEQQSEQMWCLGPWPPTRLSAGAPSTTASAWPHYAATAGVVDNEVFAHIWSARRQNVHFYGTSLCRHRRRAGQARRRRLPAAAPGPGGRSTAGVGPPSEQRHGTFGPGGQITQLAIGGVPSSCGERRPYRSGRPPGRTACPGRRPR